MAKLSRLTLWIGCALLTQIARADGARFDLAGPKVDVRVTRGDKMLPIASVPNLQPGDKLWIHPDLPPTQSVRYLLVVAFLRGTTNPPPDEWFTRIETWNRKVHEEGVQVTVPPEAQQALAFLAPVTGGDFSTLRSAVRGRPGVFVRASQDLNEAGFEQGRIEKYLASIRKVEPGDAKSLMSHSDLLARTLALRPNPDCFKRDPDQQVTCLTQTGTQTLLNDGHGQTVVAALTSGASSDLISAASYTSMAGGGMYSAYVGAVVDLARLLGGLHTAQYQYIPAIAFPNDESLNLRLNTPPSFNNPKSVIVFGLPAVQKSHPPTLRNPEPDNVTCLLEPDTAIPLQGAPLVFSTAFAHDLVLHLEGGKGGTQDVPLVADAFRGGLVPDHTVQRRILTDAPSGNDAAKKDALATSPIPGLQKGEVRGMWGFDPFHGPEVPVLETTDGGWKVVSGEPVIAGRDNRLVLTSPGNACLQSITFDAAGGASLKVGWKRVSGPAAQKNVEVDLPLGSAEPGSLQLAIHQYGSPKPVTVAVQTYSNPAKLEKVVFHAGDRAVQVTGQKLQEIADLKLGDADFLPVAGSPSDRLSLELNPRVTAPTLKSGEKLTAHVHLHDGQSIDLPVTVGPPRPAMMLRSVAERPSSNSAINLTTKGDLRVDAPVTLILKSEAPIPRDTEIEVATADQNPATALSAKLSFKSGLILQDARTLRVNFDPLKLLGSSLFGPVRVRVLDPGTDPGDWMPIGTFVRVPDVTSLTCPADATKSCALSGTGLFLVASVSNDPALKGASNVPDEFADAALPVPHPAGGLLYLRLRDDPNAIATLSLPVQPEATRSPTTPHS